MTMDRGPCVGQPQRSTPAAVAAVAAAAAAAAAGPGPHLHLHDFRSHTSVHRDACGWESEGREQRGEGGGGGGHTAGHPAEPDRGQGVHQQVYVAAQMKCGARNESG